MLKVCYFFFQKKRRTHDSEERMDDDDEAMLFVRGASPNRQEFQPHDEREDENFEFGKQKLF